jgi:SNF2 family DNA or RNA helicase
LVDFRLPDAGAVGKHGDSERQNLLSRRLRPFILRRLKTNVAKELPPKTEIIQRVTLGDDQRDLYETVRHVMNDKVRDEISNKGFARSHIVILDALLKLRQVCCDPRLVKLAAAANATSSAKLEALLEMLPTLIEDGRRILLFSQFTSMLDLIKPALDEAGIPFVELRGTTKDRRTPITRFQKKEVPLFLISLKAGGTGLNLTAADTVIHFDPWWNPSVENQATDRAHRIGQDKPVFVYKLIANGTVEERILDLQTKKANLANAIFGDNPAAAALSQDDLKWLLESV